MAKKIILLRHGQTDFNLEGKVQGHIDIPLNDVGYVQAQEAAKALANEQIVRVVTSKLIRAQVTAEKVSAAISPVPEMIVDTRLKERRFGDFEGLTARELVSGFPQQYAQWRDTGECPIAGIESRLEVGKRVAECILEYTAGVEGTVLFVGHGSALTQGLVCLLGLDPLVWQGVRGLDNCHWAELISAKRAPFWRLASYNLGVPADGPSECKTCAQL